MKQVKEPDLLREVFDLIGKIEKKVKDLNRKMTLKFNLTPSQYLILMSLSQKNSQPHCRLADTLCCTRSTITEIIDTMERKGLVKRIQNPRDRRSSNVEITDKGKKLIRELSKVEDIFVSCCSGITRGELEELKMLLQKLYKSIGDVQDGRGKN